MTSQPPRPGASGRPAPRPSVPQPAGQPPYGPQTRAGATVHRPYGPGPYGRPSTARPAPGGGPVGEPPYGPSPYGGTADVRPGVPRPVSGRGGPAGEIRVGWAAAVVLALAALLFLVVAALPWTTVDAATGPSRPVSGYRLSDLVPVAAVLLVLAAGWPLPALVRPRRNPLPLLVLPVVLTVPALSLVLSVWGRVLDWDPTPVALLAVLLVVVAVLAAVAVLLSGWRLRMPAGGGGAGRGRGTVPVRAGLVPSGPAVAQSPPPGRQPREA